MPPTTFPVRRRAIISPAASGKTHLIQNNAKCHLRDDHYVRVMEVPAAPSVNHSSMIRDRHARCDDTLRDVIDEHEDVVVLVRDLQAHHDYMSVVVLIDIDTHLARLKSTVTQFEGAVSATAQVRNFERIFGFGHNKLAPCPPPSEPIQLD